MNKLQGKIALVTGGNSGIGLSTAKLFAQEGAQVIITGRDKSTLDSAAADIGNGALAIQSDVANLQDLDSLFATIKSKYGKLDVLFANAGVFAGAPIADTTEALYDQIFNINVKGVFFAIQKAEPLLSEGASVIITASSVIHGGMNTAGLYSASKAAVRQLARNLANEFAPRGIRVNVVSPGYTRTPIVARTGANEEQVEGFYQHAAGEIPMRRVGNPDEVAKAVLFLASDDSSYTTGEELLVDGGHANVAAAGVQRV